MPTAPHVERHFTGGPLVRDVVIGMSDGLTVPFALAAGLSGATVASRIVVTAGLAEIAAGCIAMGLGGYLAARSDAEHYASELAREEREIRAVPEMEQAEIEELFAPYGVGPKEIAPAIAALRERPEAWVEFMMRFELGLERPEPARARTSALTIAASYFVGGIIPLTPYMLVSSVDDGLILSIGATLAALFLFGWVRGQYSDTPRLRSAIQTTLVGALAAAAAFGLARLVTRGT
ncbi:MAG: VIT1/CCC1 transporter family protein [Polyangiaceae bacterium]